MVIDRQTASRRIRLTAAPRRQRGAALILVVAGMVALLAMVGLALDAGHTMLNKTRLQNTVDAAALAAAKTLDETGDIAQATVAARTAFGSNAAAAGNAELDAGYANGAGNIQLTIQFSETLRPFVPDGPGPYVRVIATNFTLPAWLVQVVGIGEKRVAASAVAGPSPTINLRACNLAPMTICGDPGAGVTEDSMYGYDLYAPAVLKTSANGSWDSTPGPGNFLLTRLGGGQGAAEIRRNMAGAYNACIDNEPVLTEPGNTVGPVAQGLNTRFGEYFGPMGGMEAEYPPDVIVTGQTPSLTAQGQDIYQGATQITTGNIDQIYNYQDYVADMANPANYDYQPIADGGIGAFERRVLAVAFSDCSTATNGQGELPLLGFGCFFLLQPVTQQGNDAHVFGQFVGRCTINGTPGPAPASGPGAYIIQLYKNPDSGDS
jgi:Flp pilus assembly protein TadG